MVNKMKDHVIVCGYGQVGSSAAASLQQSGQQIVIIDSDPDRISAVHESEMIAIEGDATEDETLRMAGVERARSIIVSTGDDSLNLFIVLFCNYLDKTCEISIFYFNSFQSTSSFLTHRNFF